MNGSGACAAPFLFFQIIITRDKINEINFLKLTAEPVPELIELQVGADEHIFIGN